MSGVQSPANFLKKSVFQKVLEARALLYTIESLPIVAVDGFIAGSTQGKITEAQQKTALAEGQKLMAQDARNFAEGIYPLSLMVAPPSARHFRDLLNVYADSLRAAYHRRTKNGKAFRREIRNMLDKFPEYYQRNFHFQTDGYFSAASAKRYDMQVELLFRGTADPMRRSILRPMKAWGPLENILEVGCGAGSMTRMLAETFPESRITAVDLSPQYIEYAKKACSGLTNVDFLVGKAEDLPFKDKHFDASLSVYLLHELPKKVRLEVIDETQRVCKDDGFWGVVDSIQMGDIPDFDGFLENFPIHFHEPFFKDYVSRPLRDLMGTHKPFLEEYHLLSKVFCRKKIELLDSSDFSSNEKDPKGK